MSRKDRREGQAPAENYGEFREMQADAPAAVAAALHARRKTRQRRKGALIKSLVLLALLSAGIVVAQKAVFRLETVYVIGNETKTPQQVVLAAGLARGRNMFSIDEADVAASMARDHTLIFEGMQKEYPSTLYLYVKERRVAASMQWLGMVYTLDGSGMVMSQENSASVPAGLPVVTGLQANGIRVGQVLSLKTTGQMEAYCSIMEELYLQLYADQVSEINLATPENIYMVTAEGITVRLGDASYMRAKIGAVRTCMGRLRQLGGISGVLDVTIPETPKYMPDK